MPVLETYKNPAHLYLKQDIIRIFAIITNQKQKLSQYQTGRY